MLLASASPARRATLATAGIRHDVLVSDVDEEDLLASACEYGNEVAHHADKHEDIIARAARQVQMLATAKAMNVAQRVRDNGNPCGCAVVVGCDSMFTMGGSIVGKPHSAEVARERLTHMSGSCGELLTGHCVIDMRGGDSAGALRISEGVSRATVHIAQMSPSEISAYIASGEPLEVAGSFTIDGRGGPFVERIEGDPHGVVGISLPLLRTLLAELGYSIHDFWVD